MKKDLHIAVGTSLDQPQDLVILVGEKAAWMAEGIPENKGKESRLFLFQIRKIISIIEDFEGALFLRVAGQVSCKRH